MFYILVLREKGHLSLFFTKVFMTTTVWTMLGLLNYRNRVASRSFSVRLNNPLGYTCNCAILWYLTSTFFYFLLVSLWDWMYSSDILFFLDILCGVPPNGTNTLATFVSLFYQDIYNYTCLEGYETNHTITVECLANGSLSLEDAPNCTS